MCKSKQRLHHKIPVQLPRFPKPEIITDLAIIGNKR